MLLGGYPTAQTPSTLSAFGNRPGGGILVLGLDEGTGFSAVGVYDTGECKKALASQVRQAVHPPLTLSELVTVGFEGADVVVAVVDELSASSKPCRVTKGGKASQVP